jgi:anaerobic ribonucleoside-triphosphate reductase activating protein
MSYDLWTAGPESSRPVRYIFNEIEDLRRETNATGLTISGGEPFQQADGLKALLTLGQAAGWVDALIYSGFLIKELLAAYPWLPDLATAVVDGPYEQGRPSREIWRGSAGQTLTLFKPELTELYEKWRHDETRKVQIIVSEPDGSVRLLGIPGPGDYERLRNKLNGADHDQDL